MIVPIADSVVVIPAFRAATTLPSVLERLLRLIPADRVLVVDDGSDDATSEVVRPFGVHIIRHPSNLGKGAAVRSGMSYWKERSHWSVLITLDADGQHAPEDLPGLVEAWERHAGDIIIGARRFTGVGMPLERQWSNRITSALVSWRTGQRVPDSQCGFRLHSRRSVEAVTTTTDGFEAETEFLLRAAARGVRFGSAPIRTIYAGERSSMTYWKTTTAFIRTLLMEV